MRLLADECCKRSLVDALRAAGHDVVWAAELAAGERDRSVLERAFADDRVLVTDDKDFGELVVRLALPTRGVILLRMPGPALPAAERLVRLLALSADQIRGRLVVISARKVRFRPIPPPAATGID